MQRVLVIDDDSDIGELVCAAALAMGFECTVTTDAKLFLEQLSPDTTLIVMDLVMPVIDGVQLLRLLGKQKCKARIVLMSALGKRTIESAGQLAQVLGLSIVGSLTKPFRRDELEEVLRTLPIPEAPPNVHPRSQFAVKKEELQNAIERDEFVVYYQPQIHIASGRVIGVEALVRWQHPEHGLMFPDSFIHRMEEFGLIDELGWIVANHGMSDLRTFANGDGKTLKLALNASVNSLCNLSFPDILVSIAEKHGVSPESVTVEVLETGLLKDLSRTLDTLTRLRMKRVKVSIDDFGTGYAMMRQLKTIPATELKIDKSFIQEMMVNDRDRIMVRKTIEMGHELGTQVIAEGVEAQAQLDILRLNDCDGVQGYLFSRPIPALEMVSWLSNYRAQPVHSFPQSGELFP
jgi:EAL domain-containing protein (putative c-di-GMP-specific phosphodiesterase class I)